MRQISQLNKLNKLVLAYSHDLTSDGLLMLQHCKSIEILDIGGCSCATDEVVKTIVVSLHALIELDIEECPVSYSAFTFICNKLPKARISYNPVTNAKCS